jgi:hypothetical protein
LFLQSAYKQENTLLEFDAETEAVCLKAETKTIRNRGYRRSRLDKYTAELITLRHQGVSIAEMQRWLRGKRIKVAWSTVSRWLNNHG